MNLRGGGYGEPRSHHCTPTWVTRAKLHLKKKKKIQIPGPFPPNILIQWPGLRPEICISNTFLSDADAMSLWITVITKAITYSLVLPGIVGPRAGPFRNHTHPITLKLPAHTGEIRTCQRSSYHSPVVSVLAST